MGWLKRLVTRTWVRVARWPVLFLLLALLVHVAVPSRYRLDVTLKADVPVNSHAEIFFSLDGRHFYPENSVPLIHRVERGQHVHIGRIYSPRRVTGLRIDPSNIAGVVQWYSLRLQGSNGAREYPGQALLSEAPVLDQLQVQSSSVESLSLVASGADPKLTLGVPAELVSHPDPERKQLRMRIAGFLALCALLAVALEVCRARTAVIGRALANGLTRVAGWFSDESTIVFSRAAMSVYAVLLALASLWVALGLHLSSIGVWDDLYTTEHVERSVHLGSPKHIRGDEWDVWTPWMLSQAQTGMKIDNPNIGDPGMPIVTGSPVGGPLMLAQPKFWGFVALDVEHGFSWYWAFKVFGLIAAVFTLLLLLTKGDVLVSLGGAVAVYGSSTVQWLFSGFVPEMVIGLSMAVLGTVYLLRARKVGGMLAGALAVALVIPNLLMHLYPPHLLPLAYLAVFLILGLLANRESLARFGERLLWRVPLMVLSLVLLCWLLALWYVATADAVRLVMNTAYPGKRFLLGGDLPLLHVFHGVFESWRIDEWPVPFPPTNQSEASRLWVLFPLVLAVIPVGHWFRPAHRVKASLLAYCMFVLIWTSAPLPEPLRLALAKAGWFLSTPWHSVFGMGLVSTLLVAMLVAERARGRLEVVSASHWVLPLAVFSVVLSYGLVLAGQDPEFFVLERILLASGVVAGVAWAVAKGQRAIYLGLMLLAALPTLHVNPLQNGLAQYLEKDIFAGAKGLSANGQWAVYGDTRVAQGFKAAGLNVLNGVHYAPRMQLVGILDADHRYNDVWNRYAHVELVSAPSGAAPSYKLLFADAYQLVLDVCGPHIRRLGVTHVAYSYPPSVAELRCLTPLQVSVADPTLSYFLLK
jgi:hypothetical protein